MLRTFGPIVVCLVFLVPTGQARAEDDEGLQGLLDSARVAEVTAEATGHLTEVAVNVGDAVEAGQVLARLQSQDAELAVRAAELEVEGQKAVLDVLRRRIDGAQATAQARAQELERIRRLVETARASDAERAQAEEAFAQARSSVEIARAELQREQIHARRLEIAVEDARLALERTIVRAPLTGVVAEVRCAPGDTVRAYESLVATIVDVSRLHVVVQVPLEVLRDWAPGRDVMVEVELTGRTLAGRVERLAPLLDPETQTATAYVTIAEGGGLAKGLPPGLAVRVRAPAQPTDK